MTIKSIFAIYADPDSKVSSAPLDQEILRSLEGVSVEYITRHDLAKDAIYNEMDALFVPGIQGEHSYYPDHIGVHREKVQSFLRNGGAYFGECAGACLAGRKVYFRPHWAPHKMREDRLLEIFDGVCYAPPPGIGVDGEDPRYFRGLVTTDLRTSVLGFEKIIPIAYSSGPMFLPSKGQEMQVLARYEQVYQKPPAVISFNYGRGYVQLLGPVPQYGATRSATGLKGYEKLDELMAVMHPYEEDRKQFFDVLMRKIQRHVVDKHKANALKMAL